VAARLALAAELSKGKQPAAALEQLHSGVKLDAQNAVLWEQLGDAERSAHHPKESREAYEAALRLGEGKADRKRIQTKMAF
jgi:predicted Zn-dependent protease